MAIDITKAELAALIDHTLLKPETTESDFQRLCEEAMEFAFWSVCVPPSFVGRCKGWLKGSSVRIATVVGFPLGYTFSQVKAEECRRAVAVGADEIDMVLNISALKERKIADVEADIAGVVKAAKGCSVKVILETCLLNDDEKILGCQAAQAAGAQFVKTSTGFALTSLVPGGTTGATVKDVQLLRATVGDSCGVKASGGIRGLADALALIEAGANRLGTSQGVKLMQGLALDAKGEY